MKITRLEVFPVRPRWVFLKVHTDEGIVGLGEPSLEGYAHTVAQAVEEMGRFLIGQDPRRIEHLWQALYRGEFYRGGPVLLSAISGIEQALWDILGKWLGVPVWQLLGGPVRERIRVYAHIGGETPDDLARQAESRLEEGYTTVKFCPVRQTWPIDTLAVVKEARAKVAAVRRAIGDENDFMLDFHGHPPGGGGGGVPSSLHRRTLPAGERGCPGAHCKAGLPQGPLRRGEGLHRGYHPDGSVADW